MRFPSRKIAVFFASFQVFTVVLAQQKNLPRFEPTRQEMLERYRKASWLDGAVKNKVFKTGVQANWQQDGNTFWYCNILKDGAREYIFCRCTPW